MTEYRFPCGMLTGDTYSSRHLVPSHFGLTYVLFVETNPFIERVVIFPDYALQISLGTFSILHVNLLRYFVSFRVTDEDSVAIIPICVITSWYKYTISIRE